MNNVFKFTANLIELSVAMFGLLVVLSLLVGFDVMGPALEFINSNILGLVGIFLLYAVSKGK
tara:strand:+ start:166 stop:351 length:186 start_codon:yes stop_codon:yes gene_type:complete